MPQGCDYVVDGTLFPCWSWRSHRELWSGKHKATGMNVQILVLPDGGLVWASDPYPGSMHDVAALDASGLLEGIDPSGWIADKGYIGRGMITPHKKPPNGELSEAAKEANKSINRIRQVVERTIAHIKSWRIHPHRLPAPPAHIRADHHRRTLTLHLQNHPLNNLPGSDDRSDGAPDGEPYSVGSRRRLDLTPPDADRRPDHTPAGDDSDRLAPVPAAGADDGEPRFDGGSVQSLAALGILGEVRDDGGQRHGPYAQVDAGVGVGLTKGRDDR